jgi:uncharacterized cupin superfamily protein
MPPVLYPAAPLSGEPRGHRFLAPQAEGWSSVAVMEWELTAQEWRDSHPHDELNYVLAGTLFVEADGETVEVPAGSLVQVPAGADGRYWAPEHARMLAIYGPNPDGLVSRVDGLRSLAQPSA